jgi:hypothetical protein
VPVYSNLGEKYPMFKLEDFNQLIEYKITSGSEYLWKCFGPNARSLDSHKASAVFDAKTLDVYTIETEVDDIQYRWIHPKYKELHDNEASRRGVDPDIAYDGVKFTDIELTEIVTIIGNN